jgi:tRNA nucleotidyltransferase (CCA-adding enzyme)
MEMPPYVAQTITRLEEAGFSAYVVGGCVRDTLRGVTPHDWDIATAAHPMHVHQVFAEEKLYDIGLQHGTVAVGSPEGLVEITTFRRDGAYLDNRRPAHVGFIDSLEEDLARRDFTMNAIAYNPHRGYVDPYGGCEAIAGREITSVGNPDKRLAEDALRIMRALRFSAVLGFAIDPRLSASLHANKDLLRNIAPERISRELLRMLVGENVLPVLLEYPDVLAVFIPEIGPTIGLDQKSVYHVHDVWTHIAHAVAAGKPDTTVRLALLFHDLGKPETFFLDEEGRGHFYGHDKAGEQIVRKRLKTLKFDTATTELVAQAVSYHQIKFAPENMRRQLSRFGEPMVRLLIEVKRGDLAAHAPHIANDRHAKMLACEAKVDELITQEACFSLKDLALNGDDLKELGVPQGAEIGRILDFLLNAVVEDEVANTREALLEKLKELTD